MSKLTITHLCVAVRPQLRLSDRALLARWKGCIEDEDKTLDTGFAIREFFMDHLVQGHRVIPGGECDNFDYEKGCLGHPQEDETDE